MDGVPTAHLAKCELCGLQLNTRAEGTHQWTAGWVKVRSGGGGHGVSLPERSPRWAHEDCVDAKIRGFDRQHSLL